MDSARAWNNMIKIEETEENAVSGMVSSIRRLAIHDGPGMRTIVFLKGCSLRCMWCAAPETQSPNRELLYYPERCLGCGNCLEACPEDAIMAPPGGPRTIDRSRCTVCGECTEVCYAEALRIIGERKTVEQVIAEVARDAVFYEHSGGGVTLSGGEPLQQVEFTRALLQACKKRGFHTAMETCGFQSWKLFKTTLPDLDLLLYDVKHMDSLKHKQFTGVPNEIILSNLRIAAATGVETVIRVPVVSGFNDDEENMRAMGDFLRGINGIKRVDLLPYHRLGENTYRRLDREYTLGEVPLKSEGELQHLAEILIKRGFEVHIGG